MVRMGLESRAAGCKAQTNPLSYGGTPSKYLFITSALEMAHSQPVTSIIVMDGSSSWRSFVGGYEGSYESKCSDFLFIKHQNLTYRKFWRTISIVCKFERHFGSYKLSSHSSKALVHCIQCDQKKIAKCLLKLPKNDFTSKIKDVGTFTKIA